MSRQTADKWAARVFLFSVACVLLGVGYAFVSMNAGAFIRPEDIHVDEPAMAVRDARSLIAVKARNERAFGDFTEPTDLPASLRLQGLNYGKVHADHVDLVVARNPDVSIGARIWAVSHRRHEERATRYPEIFYFRYQHDSPVSSRNIP